MTQVTTREVTTSELQSLYEKAYNEAWANRHHNRVEITSESPYGNQVFVERDFYYCGFNWLYFRANSPENRKLRKLVSTKHDSYWGYIIDIETIGQRGNGDYEIQAEAFSAVVRYLNSLGYNVHHYSNLD